MNALVKSLRVFTRRRPQPEPASIEHDLTADDPRPVDARNSSDAGPSPEAVRRQNDLAMLEGCARRMRTDAIAAKAIADRLEDDRLSVAVGVIILQAGCLAGIARRRQETR